MKYNSVVIGFILAFMVSCSAENVLTKQQLIIQSKADREVATILFDQNITNLASYKIFKDGSIIISFDESITTQKYTEVVSLLRANKFIFGVRAQQQGNEVCPITQ